MATQTEIAAAAQAILAEDTLEGGGMGRFAAEELARAALEAAERVRAEALPAKPPGPSRGRDTYGDTGRD